ncbi:hypothetical protein H696_05577 [Fonticula alba]|uniref:Branched-chain amino acid aminotransferase n=1 Tax=Fonticula alba TaxID=691883 RepID=A0A058Z131_FONAL|nr:hypothetical protein H696_05577 [Fonticula alba]KCV67846.1 hypothetical protein H696_05577 [Fonticula alba]|eukprot:XP_009497666.1 hypothetical protein H696_05577 [Fonticula alba]
MIPALRSQLPRGIFTGVRSLVAARAYSSTAQLDASKLQVHLTDTPKPKLPNDQLIFGRTFSDHMLEIDWSASSGWEAPTISPYHKLSLDPSSMCLHYASQPAPPVPHTPPGPLLRRISLRTWAPMEKFSRFTDPGTGVNPFIRSAAPRTGNTNPALHLLAGLLGLVLSASRLTALSVPAGLVALRTALASACGTADLELITPPLDGTILPGVTRDSILSLAREWNEFKVSERPFTMPQVAQAAKEGRIVEMFGAGTAAIVSPIKCIHFKGEDINIPLDPSDPTSEAGKLTRRISDTIMGIQYGEIESEWSVVCE